MTDNFYYTCPPKCGPGFRELTNYQPNTALNESIINKNKIYRDDDYRAFLQRYNEDEWKTLKQNYSCFPNECIFDNKRTIIHPSVFNKEMTRWNSMPKVDSKKYFSDMTKKFNDRITSGQQAVVYTTKDVSTTREPFKCPVYKDYRAFVNF